MQRALPVLVALVLAALTWWWLGRGDGAATTAGHDPRPLADDGEAALPALRGTGTAGTVPAEPPAAQPTRARAPGEEAAADEVAFVGRVVDDRRRPAAGARVQLVSASGAQDENVSDADGRFRLRGRVEGPWFQGHVVARDDAARVAVTYAAGARDASGAVDVGVLVLGAGFPLEVRVRGPDGALPGAEVLLLGRAGMPATTVARGVADAAGRLLLPPLPAGPYRAVARSAGLGRGFADATLPAAAPVDVLLGSAHTLPVRVVDAATQSGIPGARVEAYETWTLGGQRTIAPYLPAPDVPPTDAEGRTALRGVGAEDVLNLRAEAEGYPRTRSFSLGGRGAPLDGTEVVLELRALRRVEWPVAAGERPVPPDGTVLKLSVSPGSATEDVPDVARMEGGRIVGDGFSPSWVHALAQAPDGSLASLFCRNDGDVGNETSFRAPRTVEVVVREADGSPARGLFASLRSQGNNLVAGPTALDAEGRAVFDALYGWTVDAYLSGDGAPWGGRMIGTVDLERGSGRVEVTLDPLVRVEVAVTIAGEPGLPGSVSVAFGGLPVRDVEEDPERGRLAFSLRLGDGPARPPLSVLAAGYAPAVLPLPAGPAAGPLRLEADLRPTGTLVVAVSKPADGEYRLSLERWDARNERWVPVGRRAGGGATYIVAGGGEAPTADGVHAFDDLVAGRYRAADGASAAASAAVDLGEGARDARLAFDLSRAGWVEGTVVVPEGRSPTDARVRAEGLEPSVFRPERGGVRPAADGTWRLRVPGDRRVTLTPWHPLLAPAEDSRGVVVTLPRGGVRLELVASGTLTFRLADDVPVGARRGSGEMVVCLFAGEAVGEPALRLEARDQADGCWRAGGYERGTWTVWIDVPARAPFVRRGVVLGEGDVDLGTLDPPRGASLRLRVLVPEGQSAPRLTVYAWKRDEPAYSRSLSTNGETEVVLRGLGPGRFEVSAAPIMAGLGGGGATRALQETIDVTGEEEVVRELDLR